MIPRHWTIERMQRQLKHEEFYAEHYALSDPLVSRAYAKRADELREAIAVRKRAAGMVPPVPVPWP